MEGANSNDHDISCLEIFVLSVVYHTAFLPWTMTRNCACQRGLFSHACTPSESHAVADDTHRLGKHNCLYLYGSFYKLQHFCSTTYIPQEFVDHSYVTTWDLI